MEVEIWVALVPPKSSGNIIRYGQSPHICQALPLNLCCRFVQKHLIPLDIAAQIDLKHLRRLRRVTAYEDGPHVLEVVLCGAASISRQELASLIWCHSEEVCGLRPRLALASKWPAYTPDQFESFSRLWPVSMRTTRGRSTPPKHIASPPSPSVTPYPPGCPSHCPCCFGYLRF